MPSDGTHAHENDSGAGVFRAASVSERVGWNAIFGTETRLKLHPFKQIQALFEKVASLGDFPPFYTKLSKSRDNPHSRRGRFLQQFCAMASILGG